MPTTETLSDPAAWDIAAAELDPFFESLGSRTACSREAFVDEPNGVEIDTSTCGYLTLTQPSLVSASASDEVTVRLAWATLNAPAPTEAHLAVHLGAESLLDLTLPVPSEAGVKEVTLPLTSDHPAGTPLFFHADNHGSNTYRLSELSLSPTASKQ